MDGSFNLPRNIEDSRQSTIPHRITQQNQTVNVIQRTSSSENMATDNSGNASDLAEMSSDNMNTTLQLASINDDAKISGPSQARTSATRIMPTTSSTSQGIASACVDTPLAFNQAPDSGTPGWKPTAPKKNSSSAPTKPSTVQLSHIKTDIEIFLEQIQDTPNGLVLAKIHGLLVNRKQADDDFVRRQKNLARKILMEEIERKEKLAGDWTTELHSHLRSITSGFVNDIVSEILGAFITVPTVGPGGRLVQPRATSEATLDERTVAVSAEFDFRLNNCILEQLGEYQKQLTGEKSKKIKAFQDADSRNVRYNRRTIDQEEAELLELFQKLHLGESDEDEFGGSSKKRKSAA